jgi:glucan 1,6-alpha-glucosidase
MLATLLFGLQGTPYIYQGQELGMTNARYALEEYRDIEIRNMAAERLAAGYSQEDILRSIHAKGRDNARTPMQWSADANAGFTSGDPWLKINPNYTAINAAAQEADPDSILNYYRKLVALRKQESVILDGRYEEILPQRLDLFAYSRENPDTRLTVVCNFTENTVDFPAEILQEAGTCALSNYPDQPVNGKLRPYEARMYLRK